MPKNPKPEKPDLSKHEDEAVPFDEIMQKLAKAKPAPKAETKDAKDERKK